MFWKKLFAYIWGSLEIKICIEEKLLFFFAIVNELKQI